jgi:hypothetical protein
LNKEKKLVFIVYMKQSRDNLFKKFDESAAYLQNTIDQRNNIWHNRGSYNYIEQVPYTHKFKVGGGGFWTKWVHKTETRYRPETRFNQQSYDNDWDSATAIVNQAEKVFNDHQQTIINQIDSMRQEIKSKDTEVTQIKSLTTQQNILKQTFFPSGSALLRESYKIPHEYSTIERECEWDAT